MSNPSLPCFIHHEATPSVLCPHDALMQAVSSRYILEYFPLHSPLPKYIFLGGGGELSLSIDTIFELFDLDVIWLCFQS